MIVPMSDDFPVDYLAGLPADQQQELARVNGPGLAALREYLRSREAVAFLGAGVSAPLYPLWGELIGELVDAASGKLTDREAGTCRALAHESTGEVVEIVRRGLGTGTYREVLRQILRVRTDPETGRSWTPVQELVCRCSFKAVMTTNYDPWIVDARMRVRPGASATGFTTWEDDALRAHEALDHAGGTGRGWGAMAHALQKRLVPPRLDPDPLATVERLVAEQEAEEADAREDRSDG